MESSSSLLVGKSINNKMKVGLPIGFRFRPTDEELLLHYLRRKVFSLPLPASVVQHDVDVFRFHPHHLPGDLKEKRYFFTNNVMTKVNGVIAGSDIDLGGHWKVNFKGGKVILGNVTNQAVGLRRCLVYYQGKKKTNWIMHEFRLLASHSTKEGTTLVQVGDWVLCRIYQKKKKTKPKVAKMKAHHSNTNVVKGSSVSAVNDLTMMEVIDNGPNGLGSPPPFQDCSSSGITEVELNDEEVCSTSAVLS